MAKTKPHEDGLSRFFLSFLKFVKEDFSFIKHIPVYLFVALTIFLLYYFDFSGWKKSLQLNTLQGTAFLFSGYSLTFFLPLLWVTPVSDLKKSGKGFLIAFLFIFLFAFTSSWSPYYEFSFFSESEYHYWFRKCLSNFTPFLFFISLIFLLKKPFFAESGSFLWLQSDRPWIRIIAPLLLGVIVIVLAGSQAGDFGSSYPVFKYSRTAGEGILPYLQVISFELAYALDFLTIEILCRGILVLGLLRYFGPHVLLPMASFYVFIHYGKPLAETISSFFGGYLLGYMAIYNRTVLPGTLLHVSLAWSMELTAVVILGSY
jgi:hypothetical protein